MSEDPGDDLRQLFARLGAVTPAAAARTPAQERLMRAALEVFAEEGFTAATTRAIAARAGVAEKTLFQAFGSKAGLFNEAVYPLLLQTIGPSVFAALREVVQATPGGLRERLRAVGKNRLALVARAPSLFKFLVQELLLRPAFRAPFIAHWKEQVYPAMRAAIAGASQAGEIKPLPPGRVLRIVVSLVVGYIITRHVLLPDLDWNDEEELDAMIEVLFRGIARR